jgi:hypothetical protein
MDQERYDEVVKLAELRDLPVAEMMSDLVEVGLEHLEEKRERRLEALDALDSLRRDLLARQGSFPDDLVSQARSERDKQTEDVLSREVP